MPCCTLVFDCKPVNKPDSTIKTGEVILLSGGLIVGYTIFSKAQALKRIIFVPGKVVEIGWHNWHLVLTWQLKAQNTSNQTMTIQSIAADLYTSNGGTKTLIGNISMFDQPVEIKANSQVIIELDATLQPIAAVNDIITAFENGNFTEQITIDGYANIDKYQVPLKETINIP